jgi:hypothetical protein
MRQATGLGAQPLPGALIRPVRIACEQFAPGTGKMHAAAAYTPRHCRRFKDGSPE